MNNEALKKLQVSHQRLRNAAELTVRILDNLTTEDFSKGGDKPARDALKAAIDLAKGL